jgi:hypothetical protein
MSHFHVSRPAALLLITALALLVAPTFSAAEDPVAPPPTELFGTVDPGESLVESDWAAAVADPFVEDQRAQGATVTTAPCIVGDRPTIQVPELRPYLRRPVQTDGQFVVTPSGNAHLVCHTSVPSPVRLPSQAIVVDGAPCFLPNRRRTNDSHIVLTPSGELILTCHATL